MFDRQYYERIVNKLAYQKNLCLTFYQTEVACSFLGQSRCFQSCRSISRSSGSMYTFLLLTVYSTIHRIIVGNVISSQTLVHDNILLIQDTFLHVHFCAFYPSTLAFPSFSHAVVHCTILLTTQCSFPLSTRVQPIVRSSFTLISLILYLPQAFPGSSNFFVLFFTVALLFSSSYVFRVEFPMLKWCHCCLIYFYFFSFFFLFFLHVSSQSIPMTFLQLFHTARL